MSTRERTPALSAEEIHVWRIPLAAGDSGVLSEDERRRADRFRFEPDRIRFIAARSALRQILGEYLETRPQSLEFSYAAKGKPELAGAHGTSAIRFNLSHSRDLALLGVTRGYRIGVDVEFMDSERAGEQIAERFFSAMEVGTLRALPANEKLRAFFQCWTRKEAYVKAIGGGLSIPLRSFDVAFGPGVAPAILRAHDSAEGARRWSVYDVNAGPEYAAVVVAEGQGRTVLLHNWNN